MLLARGIIQANALKSIRAREAISFQSCDTDQSPFAVFMRTWFELPLHSRKHLAWNQELGISE
jgi:hypothetical protein